LKAQINVSIEFTDLTFPTDLRTYTPDHIFPLDPALSYDNLRFKHKVADGGWGDCRTKSSLPSVGVFTNTLDFGYLGLKL
jgi:hypothetical protein